MTTIHCVHFVTDAYQPRRPTLCRHFNIVFETRDNTNNEEQNESVETLQCRLGVRQAVSLNS